MRAVLRRVIDLSGIPVETCLSACHGAAALETLRSERVDLILTDINMPEMNGEEFVAELKKDQALRAIPVLVISTDATSSRMQRMLELGAAGYVIKPFQPETLRCEVERVLGEVHVTG
ncbi:MAG TPA: response regulator [Bryobacteraceae bacterium]|nr:response regulator [Bryobacteraceae bacterium]